MSDNSSEFPALINSELESARRKFPKPFNSLHEAAAVIKEEYDEFWDLVKQSPDYRCPESVIVELAQIAAMCQRAAEDLRFISPPRYDYELRGDQ